MEGLVSQLMGHPLAQGADILVCHAKVAAQIAL